MDNIYCPIRAVIRNRTQGSLANPTAAERRSLQWVSDGRSRYAEPMGRWEVCLYPTAALLRSLQWVSDGRSRVAEPMGRREVCYTPQRRCFAACSGFQRVGPATRNIGGRWEVCYTPQRRCFAACSGFRMVGPATRNLWGVGDCSTHSCAASQLAVGFRWSVPLCGTYGVRWEMAVSCVRCTVPCVDALWHA